MLLNSGVRIGGGPMRTLGGAGALTVERWGWEQRGATLNIYAGEATVIAGSSIANWLGAPSGYLNPGSWSLPIKPGGMTSRNRIAGTGTLSATGAAGWDTSSTITGAGSVSASLVGAFIASASVSGTGAIVVTLTALGNVDAALTGAGTVASDASAAAILAAALAGAGDLSGTASASVSMVSSIDGAATITADILGAAGLTAGLTGAGAISADAVGAFLAAAELAGATSLVVVLTADGSMISALDGAGSVAAFLAAQGNMECSIAQTVETLTTDTIAAAVWAHGTALSLVDAVTLIRQISDNRLEVDITGQRLVLFDDDGTTELRAWALATDGGEGVATATGVQTRRGVPT